jgi:hypothetical protein
MNSERLWNGKFNENIEITIARRDNLIDLDEKTE